VCDGLQARPGLARVPACMVARDTSSCNPAAEAHRLATHDMKLSPTAIAQASHTYAPVASATLSAGAHQHDLKPLSAKDTSEIATAIPATLATTALILIAALPGLAMLQTGKPPGLLFGESAWASVSKTWTAKLS
jgi:hypothetical protein